MTGPQGSSSSVPLLSCFRPLSLSLSLTCAAVDVRREVVYLLAELIRDLAPSSGPRVGPEDDAAVEDSTDDRRTGLLGDHVYAGLGVRGEGRVAVGEGEVEA